jgi:hypothetical protein
MKDKNRLTYKQVCLFLFLITEVIFIIGIATAGFGSTYLPNANGENIFEVPIGSNKSYFIYLQNMGNDTLLIKINITDKNKVVLNTLKEMYEIPPNTKSDDFPIELVIGLSNDKNLIGQKFPLSYAVLSSIKTNETENIVTFSPIGYEKTFYVLGTNAIPIQQKETPEDTHSSSSSGTITYSGITSTSSKTKKTTENTEIATPQITTPKEENKPTPIIPLSNLGFIMIFGLVMIGASIVTIWFKKRSSKEKYKNYGLNTI